ncbi:DUF445 domain-containing protein [Kozakia baliensis]|uniref:Uncharacterized protein n=1 Tax=Kozakia baliensis TaxID=153496 RepID=A0A1D8UTX0_9PROT|nr:DUF445 domain-containing protein [Kozakia baliensis]AOX17093.1 hypothetical protein A0U89_07980 [Kozakia baliensis]GBR24881.1 hypothetical protein AA0488_0499 [Kozakia baliensis NRIC 0488]GEL63837.1 hypothetical protein KBA01_11230 [Kozakia baliensis]
MNGTSAPLHRHEGVSSVTSSSAEADAIAALRTARRIASGLLLGMGGVMLLATGLPAWHYVPDSTALEMLRSGARAGVVGGIADWFAVTALFRHPLGLPIPHTAILPRQQKRLGQGLGRFISTQFFTEQDVIRALQSVDVPSMLADALRQPETLAAVTRTIRRTVPSLLDRLEDGRASAAINRALPVLLKGETTAPIMARALRAMVDSELHQEVLSFILDRTKRAVQKREPALRAFIEERVREQGGRVVGWAIGASVAGRVLSALYVELDRVDPRNSELREGFTQWVRQEIDRLETDPARRASLGRGVVDVLGHESLKAWSGELWQKLRSLAEADLEHDDGWSASVIEASLLHLADQMKYEEALRDRITRGISVSVIRVLPSLREKLSGFIASVMGRWDASVLSTKLEQRVGRDLQYIRINGTIVGFLVGAGLDAVLRLCFGPFG